MPRSDGDELARVAAGGRRCLSSFRKSRHGVIFDCEGAASTGMLEWRSGALPSAGTTERAEEEVVEAVFIRGRGNKTPCHTTRPRTQCNAYGLRLITSRLISPLSRPS